MVLRVGVQCVIVAFPGHNHHVMANYAWARKLTASGQPCIYNCITHSSIIYILGKGQYHQKDR